MTRAAPILRPRGRALWLRLPADGAYGVAMLFLPRESRRRKEARALVDVYSIAGGRHRPGLARGAGEPELLGELAEEPRPHISGGLRKCSGHRKGIPLERTLTWPQEASSPRPLPPVSRWGAVRQLPSRAEPLSTRACSWLLSSSASIPTWGDPEFESALAVIHQRYSTNTFPSWPLAQLLTIRN